MRERYGFSDSELAFVCGALVVDGRGQVDVQRGRLPRQAERGRTNQKEKIPCVPLNDSTIPGKPLDL